MSTSKEQAEDYIKYLNEPLNILDDKSWTPKENETLKRYQENIKELFECLKEDGCITFTDFFPSDLTQLYKKIDSDKTFADNVKILGELSNKIIHTKEFNSEEKWRLFLSLYLTQCETLENVYEDFIWRINDTIPSEKKLKAKPYVILETFVSIMTRYRNSKFSLFNIINVDLRNAIAHLYFNFGADYISYKDKRVKGITLISNYRMIAALVTLSFAQRNKVFAKECEELAREQGLI